MTTPVLNHKNHTIEMTKKFYKASCKFGTDEYEIIFKMLERCPNYKPVIKTTAKSKKSEDSKKTYFKGLTYKYMEEYIADHDNEKKEIRAEYDEMRKCAKGHSSIKGYDTIKKWFLKKYPAVANFCKEDETENNNEKEADKLETAETAKSEATETTTIKMSESKEIA